MRIFQSEIFSSVFQILIFDDILHHKSRNEILDGRIYTVGGKWNEFLIRFISNGSTESVQRFPCDNAKLSVCFISDTFSSPSSSITRIDPKWQFKLPIDPVLSSLLI